MIRNKWKENNSDGRSYMMRVGKTSSLLLSCPTMQDGMPDDSMGVIQILDYQELLDERGGEELSITILFKEIAELLTIPLSHVYTLTNFDERIMI